MGNHAVSKDLPVMIVNDDDRRKACYIIGFWCQDDHRLAEFRPGEIACHADGVAHFFDLGKGKSKGDFQRLLALARADLPYWYAEFDARQLITRYEDAVKADVPVRRVVTVVTERQRQLALREARRDLELLRGPEIECYFLCKLAALLQRAKRPSVRLRDLPIPF